MLISAYAGTNPIQNSNLPQTVNINNTDTPPSEQTNVPTIITQNSSNFQDQIVPSQQNSQSQQNSLSQQNIPTQSNPPSTVSIGQVNQTPQSSDTNLNSTSTIQNTLPSSITGFTQNLNSMVQNGNANPVNMSPTDAQPYTANSSSAPQPSIYTVESTDGPSYLKAIKEATQPFGHDESLAAFAAAALIPVKPDADYAAVCIQKTRNGLFRIHSQNPAALGILTGRVDKVAFKALFKLNKWATFDYNVPANADGTGNITTYYGQVFLKHGDGTVHGDVICFARYR